MRDDFWFVPFELHTTQVGARLQGDRGETYLAEIATKSIAAKNEEATHA